MPPVLAFAVNRENQAYQHACAFRRPPRMQFQPRVAIIRLMKVIIDTDPGGDDAIALMWLASLAHQGRIELQAVTTAAGNVGADKTWRNANGLLRLCGLGQTPTAIGATMGKERDAAEVHGEDGMGGLARELPTGPAPLPSTPQSSQVLTKLLAVDPANTALLAVAPLTNLARAENEAPGTLARASNLIIMGGALGSGNVTPAAEFNFYFDAAAAASVVSAHPLPRLVTLETSTRLRLTRTHVGAIILGHDSLQPARFFARLCAFMTQRDRQIGSGLPDEGFPVHDAATVAWLAYPNLFAERRCQVRVDAEDGPSRGRLRQSQSANTQTCLVATSVDSNGVLEMLTNDLRFLFDTLRANDCASDPGLS